ncbi:protein of unknown function [Burkholderia multivorans]
MRYRLTRRHIPKVAPTMRKAGGVPLGFLKITMNDVVLTEVEPSGVGDACFENVKPAFTKVTQEFTLQNRAGRQWRNRYCCVRHQGKPRPIACANPITSPWGSARHSR